jgi:polyisoprenoid-binding protein YceI
MGIFTRKTTGGSVAAVDRDDFDAATQAIDDVSGDYVLDPSHTRIGFSARHAMVTNVRGQFDSFEGAAHIDVADPAASTVSVTIKAASVTTGQEQRDGHLKTADFFDVENYPDITFVSTAVERDGSSWSIAGDLTIKTVSHPVTVLFEEIGSAKDPYGNIRVGCEGGATLNRSDWGLSFNAALETGGVLVSEKIKLEFDISAIATATAAA